MVTTASVASREAKKNVENRFGVMGGGTQWENHTRLPGSTTTDASSVASRAAAAAAVASSSGLPSVSTTASPSSIRPPGKTHMPPKATFEFFRSMSSSRPLGPSRITTTVAAGINSEVPVVRWRCSQASKRRWSDWSATVSSGPV